MVRLLKRTEIPQGIAEPTLRQGLRGGQVDRLLIGVAGGRRPIVQPQSIAEIGVKPVIACHQRQGRFVAAGGYGPLPRSLSRQRR